MSCNNCFNGCTEVVSDKCVKYTGIDIPSLGISKNDPLLIVSGKITEQLLKLIDGTGVVPYINSNSLCNLVSSYLPSEGTVTIVNIIDAIFKSICSLQTQVTNVQNSVNVIEADYVITGLPGVSVDSKTHTILQATINKLNDLNVTYSAFVINVNNNFVKVADIDNYIETYLTSIGTTSLVKAKMIPYVAMEYYGPLTNFDVTGAGTGDWIDVYLCNGNNGTPDKRGRVAVGTTTGMGGGAFPAQTDPSLSGNPTYTLNSTEGSNQVTLNTTQIPSHNHTASATSLVIDNGHTHDWGFGAETDDSNSGGSFKEFTQKPGTNGDLPLSPIQNATTGISVNTNVVVNSNGGGLPHTNIQPSLACHYIIHLP